MNRLVGGPVANRIRQRGQSSLSFLLGVQRFAFLQQAEQKSIIISRDFVQDGNTHALNVSDVIEVVFVQIVDFVQLQTITFL